MAAILMDTRAIRFRARRENCTWFTRETRSRFRPRIESAVSYAGHNARAWVESRSRIDTMTDKPYRQFCVALLTIEPFGIQYLHRVENDAWPRLVKAEAVADMDRVVARHLRTLVRNG